MEDREPYRTSRPKPVQPLNNPDSIGAHAAIMRASAKAIARDLAAGLKPIIVPNDDEDTAPELAQSGLNAN